MRDPFGSSTQSGKKRWWNRLVGRRWWRNRALDIDSYVDSTLHNSGHDFSHFYESVIVFFRRFQIGGLGRWLNEAASEGMTLAVAGGLVAAAFAVPAFDEISGDWRAQHEFAVTFLDRHGNEIGKRGILHSDQVELEDLPDHLIKAVLATEDRRFFSHFGIDVFGLARAMVENARAGGVVQGGSSITQQLAKNLFLSNERTLQRKIKEAYLSLWLEANLTKQEILKLYFDRAYMGGGAFGVAAATEFYFGKSARDLTMGESAMLAGLFKAPARYAPHINLPAARARANEVLTNMVQAGFVSEGQVIGARRNPAKVVERDIAAAPNYFLDWAFGEVKDLVRGDHRILVVRTSIDMHLQRAADAAVETSLRESGEAFGVNQAAFVAMDPDGTVRAMVGGRDYGTSTFNRAVHALRQPGSSFKPFVYATALANGYTPESTIVDAPIRIGKWSPQNYNRSYRGVVTLKTALTKSINTIPVRLSLTIGRQPIADTAEKMGLLTPLRVTRSLPLGTSEVTVLGMANAYSAFSSGGYRANPSGILQISATNGEVLYRRSEDGPKNQRVLSVEVAAGMVEMLHNVTVRGTGRRAQLPGIPAAGKTGTTQAYRDAWFVGFTGNFTAAVWFGNDNFSGTKRLTGGRLPAQTWQKFMRAAHVNTVIKDIPHLVVDPKDFDRTKKNGKEVADDLFSRPRTNQLPIASSRALDALGRRLRRAAKPANPSQAANTVIDDPRITTVNTQTN